MVGQKCFLSNATWLEYYVPLCTGLVQEQQHMLPPACEAIKQSTEDIPNVDKTINRKNPPNQS